MSRALSEMAAGGASWAKVLGREGWAREEVPLECLREEGFSPSLKRTDLRRGGGVVDVLVDGRRRRGGGEGSRR